MTKQQLIRKYESEEIAEQIIKAKQADEELKKTSIKDHPDCPGNKARKGLSYHMKSGSWFLHACCGATMSSIGYIHIVEVVD